MNLAASILVFALSAISAMAENPYSPDSDYCKSVIKVETLNFPIVEADGIKKGEHIKDTMSTMAFAIQDFLESITPEEREIIRVEGLSSPRLVALDRRFENFEEKFKSPGNLKTLKFNRMKNLQKTQERDRYGNPIDESRISGQEVENEDYGYLVMKVYSPSDKDFNFTAKIKISTLKEELPQLKSFAKIPASVPTLENYLLKSVPLSCFKNLDVKRAVANAERSSGKKVPEKSSPKKESSGAVTSQ